MTNRHEETRGPCEPVTGRPAERHEGSHNGPVAFPGSGRPDRDTVSVLDAARRCAGAGRRHPTDRGDDEPSVVAGHHHTIARDFRGGPAGAGRRRRTGRHSAEATAARGHLVRTTGVPPSPPRPVVDRIHAWLAVALVAAVVVLVAVASDAATAPPPGSAERPVVTTVVTLPVPSDPRATEGPAPQDRHRVLSW